MIDFDLKTDIKKVADKLGKDFERLDNFNVPLKRSGVYMLAETDRNFKGQHTPDGVPWKRLKSITKFSRKKRGGAQALQDTGLLKTSPTFRLESETKMTITSIRKVGNVDLAAVHQFGKVVKPKKADGWLTVPIHKLAAVKTAAEYRATGKTYIVRSKKGTPFIMLSKAGQAIPLFVLKKSVTIPAREFLGFSAKNIDFVEKIFADWAVEELTKK